MHRRRFLVTTGALAGVATAGCLGDDQDDPETAAEAYIEAFVAADVDELDDLFHPEMGLSGDDVAVEEDRDIELVDVEADAVVEDVQTDDIERQNGQTGIEGFTFFVDPDTVEAVLEDEDIAVVEVEYEIDDAGETVAETIPVLLATDDGEWHVLDFVSL